MTASQMFTAASNVVAHGVGSPVTFAACCVIVIVWPRRDGAAIQAKLARGARGYPCVNANFDSDLS